MIETVTMGGGGAFGVILVSVSTRKHQKSPMDPKTPPGCDLDVFAEPFLAKGDLMFKYVWFVSL